MEKARAGRYKGEQRSLNNLGKRLHLGREGNSTRDTDKQRQGDAVGSNVERQFGTVLLQRGGWCPQIQQ